MSLFKNFNKLIKQSSLNNPSNNYLLTYRFKFSDPALYSIGSKVGLQDPFDLPLVSYHITRKIQSDRALLEQLEGAQGKEDVKAQVLQDLQAYESRIDGQIDDLKRIFRGHLDFPVQHAIQTLYTLENNDRSDVEFYEKTLFPAIKAKIQYASKTNLADLAICLSELKYFEDKELWNAVVERLEAKYREPQYQPVGYYCWRTDQFVEAKKTGE